MEDNIIPFPKKKDDQDWINSDERKELGKELYEHLEKNNPWDGWEDK